MDIKHKIDQIAIKHFGGNNVMFANALSTSETNIRNYRTGKSTPKLEFIVGLSSLLGISLKWLLKNGEEMYEKREEEEPAESAVVVRGKLQRGAKLIPLFDAVAIGGSNNVADMSAIAQPAEMINAGDFFVDATAAMRVHGDSMIPKYKPGSIIGMKEVRNKRSVLYGEDYVIETDDFRVIKTLQSGSEKGQWLAVSANTAVYESGPLAGRLMHEPIDIYVDDVTRLWLVLGSMQRNQSSGIVYRDTFSAS